MRREPTITFQGALQILGQKDRSWLNRMNSLLGGVILGAGLAPATVAAGAIWSWVDEDDEAVRLLERSLEALSGRLAKSAGLSRHELIVAAHTAIAMTAFFDALRDMWHTLYDAASISEAEKIMMTTEKWRDESTPLVNHLYCSDVPCPSATVGFGDNVELIKDWAARTASRVIYFFNGLDLASLRHRRTEGRVLHANDEEDISRLAERAADRYRSLYIELAAEVQEFKVWSDLAEHATMRSALARMEKLLTVTDDEGEQRDLLATIRAVNEAELPRPVIDVQAEGYDVNVVFPSVEEIFLAPHFRITSAGPGKVLSDERWWLEQRRLHDIDLMLARHFSSPLATRYPLLILGHPGAGKSLLTKVLAARLPTDLYTVVRVPLRVVDADAEVPEQIQQALTKSTNGRIRWSELSDQSPNLIRVVILDGLDELLQATKSDRRRYVNDIVEFQRIEYVLGRPVAIVVTSRVLVADRVRIPSEVPVVKLDEFDDDQVAEWIEIWNAANADVAAKPMSTAEAFSQRKLARQPLLLLMLTLYFTDSQASLSPDTGLSELVLYQRMFNIYARREVAKSATSEISPKDLTSLAERQVARLSIAAVGMFNRGMQSIADFELSADLMGVEESIPDGERVLGEFFFVYAAEATAGSLIHRSYEFLHATFGEYLVASLAYDTLSEVAESAFGRRRFHDPDDELLFALFSYQPFAVQAPILRFISDRFSVAGQDDLECMAKTLDILIADYKNRPAPHRFLDYRPARQGSIASIATYSANLVLMRVAMNSERVPLSNIFANSNPDAEWRALVALWSAGLDPEGYRAVLSSLGIADNSIYLSRDSDPSMPMSIRSAIMQKDLESERWLRLGCAVFDGRRVRESDDPELWEDCVVAWLLTIWAWGRKEDVYSLSQIKVSESVSEEIAMRVARRGYDLFGRHVASWDRGTIDTLLRWLMQLPVRWPYSSLPFLVAESIHPGFLEDLETWASREGCASGWMLTLRGATTGTVRWGNVEDIMLYLRATSSLGDRPPR